MLAEPGRAEALDRLTEQRHWAAGGATAPRRARRRCGPACGPVELAKMLLDVGADEILVIQRFRVSIQEVCLLHFQNVDQFGPPRRATARAPNCRCPRLRMRRAGARPRCRPVRTPCPCSCSLMTIKELIHGTAHRNPSSTQGCGPIKSMTRSTAVNTLSRSYLTDGATATVARHGVGSGPSCEHRQTGIQLPAGLMTKSRSVWKKQSAPEKHRGQPIRSTMSLMLLFRALGS